MLAGFAFAAAVAIIAGKLGQMIELEVFGPLTTLGPGERTTMTIDCTVEEEER